MAGPRIRHAETQREMERTRDDLMTTGYKVKSTGENSTLLSNAGWGNLGGHLIVALLTVWWTLGIGNLIYAVIEHAKGDEVLIKVDDSSQTAGA
jgi:hypothetical protein